MESSAIGAGLFLLGEPMTDILQAAQSYKQLLDVEYQILLGKKNNTLSISVTFEDTHFFHLAGLQYLKDLKKLLTGNRGRFFRSILKGNISHPRTNQAENISAVHFFRRPTRTIRLDRQTGLCYTRKRFTNRQAKNMCFTTG